MSTIANSFDLMRHDVYRFFNRKLHIQLHLPSTFMCFCGPQIHMWLLLAPMLTILLILHYVKSPIPTIVNKAMSQMSCPCIMMNFCFLPLPTPLCNLWGTSKRHAFLPWNGFFQNSCLMMDVLSWRKCWQ